MNVSALCNNGESNDLAWVIALAEELITLVLRAPNEVLPDRDGVGRDSAAAKNGTIPVSGAR